MRRSAGNGLQGGKNDVPDEDSPEKPRKERASGRVLEKNERGRWGRRAMQRT